MKPSNKEIETTVHILNKILSTKFINILINETPALKGIEPDKKVTLYHTDFHVWEQKIKGLIN